VVHTDRAVPKISMTAHPHSLLPGRQAERPPPASHDDHHGLDPHIWLSPARVKIQAEAIAAALQAADPAHRSAYQANSQEFYTALEALDEELKTAFAGRQGRRFMVFHPSWGYFAHDYGLQQVSIQIEGKDPKPAQLQKLIEHARQNRIKVVFVQPQFSAKSAEMIAREIDGRVVVADPMARDWFANIRAVARAFQAALE
jgi:zinc transport system substrate-binding protein